MIQSFKSTGTEDIFNGVGSPASRSVCPQSLWKIASRKLDQIDSAELMNDLRIPPGNRLELLKGIREGQYSVRINQQ
jgi:proteic killer suppression protein